MTRTALLLIFLLPVFPAYASEEGDEVETAIFNQYLEQARAGDVTAQFVVARRLERGTGTSKNIEEAYIWYRKAAKKGHPLAQFIIDSKKPLLKPVPAKAKPGATPPTKTASAKPAATPARPIRKTTSSAPKQVSRVFDTEDVIMSGKWRRKHDPVGFLPSTRSSCLKANAAQVICFSENFKHVVGGKELTYTVKSTLTQFDKSGRFNVSYLYNVLEIDRNRTGARSYAPRIAAKTGWQKPGQKLKCQLNSEKSVVCTDIKGAVVKIMR
jgi:Sel1 repeat